MIRIRNHLRLKILMGKIKLSSLKKSSIIVVIGGDGFMLQTLKGNYRLKAFLWDQFWKLRF